MNARVAIGDELEARLETDRRRRDELEAQLEVRDQPLRLALAALDQRRAEARAQREKLQVQREEHRAATQRLEALQTALSHGLSAWQKSLARAFEPAGGAAMLFCALVVWGLAPASLTTLMAEVAGLALGFGLARLRRARG